jgi:hypothetical protein
MLSADDFMVSPSLEIFEKNYTTREQGSTPEPRSVVQFWLG